MVVDGKDGTQELEVNPSKTARRQGERGGRQEAPDTSLRWGASGLTTTNHNIIDATTVM